MFHKSSKFRKKAAFPWLHAAGVLCPIVPGRASQQPAIKALWLSERQRVPQGPPAARSAGQPEGPRGAGGFFWFVFFSEKENEQKPIRIVKSRFIQGVTVKVSSCPNIFDDIPKCQPNHRRAKLPGAWSFRNPAKPVRKFPKRLTSTHPGGCLALCLQAFGSLKDPDIRGMLCAELGEQRAPAPFSLDSAAPPSKGGLP